MRELGITDVSVSIDGRETYNGHAITAGSGTKSHVDDHQQVEGIGDELAHDGHCSLSRQLIVMADEEAIEGV